MALPGQQNQLVKDAIAAAKAHQPPLPVVALLFMAGPVDPSLFDEADAVLDCLYPAETTGEALANVLYGRRSPAGRLPFSWPTNGSDVPPVRDPWRRRRVLIALPLLLTVARCNLQEINYTMVGRTYRYDQRNVKWPFGFGLSYSTFSYGKAALSAQAIEASACANVSITFDVTNIGQVKADEVAQAYLRWNHVTPTNGVNPTLSLVDFVRIHDLAPGATASVNLTMTPRRMAVLTPPRCGALPFVGGKSLRGAPFRQARAASAAECCSRCAALEQCEAFMFDPGATAAAASCALYTAWGLEQNASSAAVVLGQPLNEWVLRQSVLEVLVGGSSASAVKVGEVRITGEEVALIKCGLPNRRG